MDEREIFIDLGSDLRIPYRRTNPPPPITYATTLEVLEEGRWETIRLWDNAHDPAEHHEHAYRLADGKQPPVVGPYSTVNVAMAAAITSARRHGEEHMRRWKEER